ncbi:MAG TPA: response regulator transcription factor [Candidatus Acidoferrales bacterium]|nr:response regulator transcription factor [Candidatus Acidoferrales bacterium]
MNSAKILVVDDEPQVRRVMRVTLTAEGYTIFEARNGEEALVNFRTEQPDIVLLDVNMPVMDGIATCREIRRSSAVPIIMLTVRSGERDKVQVLDAGADDYVVKPFSTPELLARIRAALRRSTPLDKLPAFTSKELSIDFEARRVNVGGREVHLTPKEFDLLRQLVANQGKPLTHRRLLQAVWGPDYGNEPEYLRVTINQLRKKIEADPAKPRLILTEPWVGYRFQPPNKDARGGRTAGSPKD